MKMKRNVNVMMNVLIVVHALAMNVNVMNALIVARVLVMKMKAAMPVAKPAASMMLLQN